MSTAVLHEALETCKRVFNECAFFRQLAADRLSPAAIKYAFGQYGHFRIQLHRWFAACVSLNRDASQPAQRQAILALSNHICTDLRDNHDLLFAEFLQDLGFPAGTLHSKVESHATTAYIASFLDDCRAPTATWHEALAALSGRELSVVVRNQRLLRSHFAPRTLRAPTWITLHAELEVDHFLDLAKPALAQQPPDTTPPAFLRAIERTIRAHAHYLDALLQEHEAEHQP